MYNVPNVRNLSTNNWTAGEFSGNRPSHWKKSHIKILPANEDQGIVFKRIDLNKNLEVKATYDQVSSAKILYNSRK